jgi:putative transposase
MCEMLQLSRASYYRHWAQQEPDQAEMALRDAIQKESLQHRFYGYRRIAVVIQRHGWVVSTKVVRRILHHDNLLAARRRQFVSTTDSHHGFRASQLGALDASGDGRPAVGGGYDLHPTEG